MSAPFHLAGETTALAAAAFWACSSIAWHQASRRIGSVAVTTIRIALAAVALCVIHALVYGDPWPTKMPWQGQAILALSGVFGAGLGDLLLFRSFMLVGPRVGMLMLTLSPILAALITRFTPMHERLGLQTAIGVIVTVGGVAWAVSAPASATAAPLERRQFRRGLWLALAGSLAIGVGFALTKLGLRAAGAGQAFSGTLVRVAAATAFCIAALPVTGQVSSVVAGFRHGSAMAIISVGVVIGPILGIWLSLMAFDWAPTGVVSALVGTAPIFMIPLSRLVYGDRPTLRSLAGTLLAVGGTAILFLGS
jgi:drug/metabolite transporter (DMT)-like permease